MGSEMCIRDSDRPRSTLAAFASHGQSAPRPYYGGVLAILGAGGSWRKVIHTFDISVHAAASLWESAVAVICRTLCVNWGVLFVPRTIAPLHRLFSFSGRLSSSSSSYCMRSHRSSKASR